MIYEQRLNVRVWPWVLAKLMLPVETVKNAKVRTKSKDIIQSITSNINSIMFNSKYTVNL